MVNWSIVIKIVALNFLTCSAFTSETSTLEAN